MKKRNQAPTKKGRTTKKSAQQQPRLPSPTAIRLREVGPKLELSQPSVKTGPLVWDIWEFQAAERNLRFATIELTVMQNLQLKANGFELREFLRIATNSQLWALKGTAPLTLTEYFIGGPDAPKKQPSKILALRGRGPGGVDQAWMRHSRSQIAAELRRRGIDRAWMRSHTAAESKRRGIA